MKLLTRENLIKCYKGAKSYEKRYVGVLIEMTGFEKPEVIINQSENFDKKLAYYIDAYDENLNHKHAQGIKIIGFTHGNYFDDIEEDLLVGFYR